MILLRLIALTLISSPALAAGDNFLTLSDIDPVRDRATLKAEGESPVPLGTLLRIHGKKGTCMVRVIERVNDELIAETSECDAGVLSTGMRLAYSTETAGDWPNEGRFVSGTTETTNDLSDIAALLKDRISVYLGHNFSSHLEGKVRADGSYKDLNGNSAFSMGVLGKAYEVTPMIAITAGIGHEFTRSFDEATYIKNNQEMVLGVDGNRPEISIWSLIAQGEFKLIDKLQAFGGLNYSIPNISRVPWRMTGDIGFQVGANYEVYQNLMVESLIKITNMNLKNEIGETTDVSLSGLEIRGRYTF